MWIPLHLTSTATQHKSSQQSILASTLSLFDTCQNRCLVAPGHSKPAKCWAVHCEQRKLWKLWVPIWSTRSPSRLCLPAQVLWSPLVLPEHIRAHLIGGTREKGMDVSKGREVDEPLGKITVRLWKRRPSVHTQISHHFHYLLLSWR